MDPEGIDAFVMPREDDAIVPVVEKLPTLSTLNKLLTAELATINGVDDEPPKNPTVVPLSRNATL
jgi:hypothetical protein